MAQLAVTQATAAKPNKIEMDQHIKQSTQQSESRQSWEHACIESSYQQHSKTSPNTNSLPTQTYKQTDRQTDRQTNTQTDRKQTERVTNRQTDRQTDKQTDTHIDTNYLLFNTKMDITIRHNVGRSLRNARAAPDWEQCLLRTSWRQRQFELEAAFESESTVIGS